MGRGDRRYLASRSRRVSRDRAAYLGRLFKRPGEREAPALVLVLEGGEVSPDGASGQVCSGKVRDEGVKEVGGGRQKVGFAAIGQREDQERTPRAVVAPPGRGRLGGRHDLVAEGVGEAFDH
jgi:hypothetical protein